MRHIVIYPIRAAAGGMAAQPGVTVVPLLRVLVQQLLIHDRSHVRRQQPQRQLAADVGGPSELHLVIPHLLQLLLNVIRRPAKLTENKRRRLVQLYRTHQRENHVFRPQRIAGSKTLLRFQGKGQAVAIGARLPTACGVRRQLLRRGAIRRHQALIEVDQIGRADGFKALRRIEADNALQRTDHHQGILRGGGLRTESGRQRAIQQGWD